MKRIRMQSGDRYQQLIDAALKLTKRYGIRAVTLAAVGAECKCSPTLLAHYFGTIAGLRDAILRFALARHQLTVAAQIVHALDLPEPVMSSAIRADFRFEMRKLKGLE